MQLGAKGGRGEREEVYVTRRGAEGREGRAVVVLFARAAPLFFLFLHPLAYTHAPARAFPSSSSFVHRRSSSSFFAVCAAVSSEELRLEKRAPRLASDCFFVYADFFHGFFL